MAGFSRSRVSIRERDDIGCLLLNSAVDVGEIHAVVSTATGIVLPLAPGAISRGANRLGLWLTPRSWLLQCALDEDFTLAERINAAFPDKIVHAAHFSDDLCWLELIGEGTLTLLREGGFVSLERDGLPAGNAKRTLIAGVSVIAIRFEESGWMIGVERSRARYFVEWLTSRT